MHNSVQHNEEMVIAVMNLENGISKMFSVFQYNIHLHW